MLKPCALAAFLLCGWGAAGQEIEILTRELPWAIVDRPWTPPPLQVRVSGRCPVAALGFSVVGGALPPGVVMSAYGDFSGIPRRMGRFPVRVRVANGCLWTAQLLEIEVTGPPLLRAEPAQVFFQARQGESPPSHTVQVSGTWPRLPYEIAKPPPWLRVEPQRGYLPRIGAAVSSDLITLTPDTTTLAPGSHRARIRIYARDAANAPEIDVLLVISK